MVDGVSKKRLAALPEKPGVYLMKDIDGEVIYIGKAVNLRSRVRNYFGKGDGRHSSPYIKDSTETVQTLVTENERQALLLESDLIKKYKPKYNIRLKDDKAHLLVRIDFDSEWPRLELTRFQKKDGATYIGPFVFTYELRTLLEVIKKTLPLRTCSDRMMNNRVRPCLEYQIKRCSGPCCIAVDAGEYREWLEQAIRILNGDTSEVKSTMEMHLKKAAEELRFEDAALYRDRLQILERVSEDVTNTQFTNGSSDCFGLYREGDHVELSILTVRRGRLFESKTYGFKNAEVSNEELLSTALMQFYTRAETIPEEILVPFEVDSVDAHEEIYSEKRGAKVQIKIPLRGSKARLLVLANQNAKQNFEARFSDTKRSDRILRAIQSHLSLVEMPRVIECVDISHFQGGQTVGAVVSFKDGKPDKSRYRTFHLSVDGKPDDFASIKEVMERHLSRCAEENTLCDLMVVDGGRQQLREAVKARDALGLTTPVMVGMAKKRTQALPYFARPQNFDASKITKPERFFLEDEDSPVVLKPNNEALHLLERIRNETHRVAITFHRKTRKKQTLRSVLDDLPGVGEKRRNLLLKEFGSVKAIHAAEAENISERVGIPLSLAKRIKVLLAGRIDHD